MIFFVKVFNYLFEGFDSVRIQEKLRGSESSPVDLNELRRQLLFVDFKIN